MIKVRLGGQKVQTEVQVYGCVVLNHMLNCDFLPSDRLFYRTEETKGHLHDG